MKVVTAMSYLTRIHNRPRIPRSIFLFILALFATAGLSRAQDPLSSVSQKPQPQNPVPALAPTPTTSDASPKADASRSGPYRHHDSSGPVHSRDKQRGSSNGFSISECLFCNAFKPGAGTHTNRFSNPAGEQDDLNSFFQGSSGFNSDRSRGSSGMGADGMGAGRMGTGEMNAGGMGAGGMGAGMNGAHRMASGDQKVDQLTRSDLGMYLKSSLGKFGVTYQDNLLGRKSNSLGSGMGQGSPRATFNSSSFANGIFNLSATESMAGSAHSGFSANSMSGNGFGNQFGPGSTDRRPTTSVSLHLSFK
jgi:hypothetical protein